MGHQQHPLQLIDLAKKKLAIARHMLTATYPLVKDAKLLAAALENIFLALTNAMAAILYNELRYKRIEPFQDNFNSKFAAMKEIEDKQDIPFLEMIRDIKETIVEHRKSPMEFSRNGRLVICSSDYTIRQVSAENLKKYINNANSFINKAITIVSKDAILR